jgi:hypothetical protein
VVTRLLQLLHRDADVVEDTVNAGAPGREIRRHGFELLHTVLAVDGDGADAYRLKVGETLGELRVAVGVVGL